MSRPHRRQRGIAAPPGAGRAGPRVAGVADHVDPHPPISGQKSVILNSRDSGLAAPPAPLASTRLTVRLAVNPGDRFVRFSLRPFSRYATPVGTYGTSIKVAVPGGEISSVALPGSETLAVQPPLTGGAQVLMGDVRPMEAALPAGATDEVVFDFEISPPSGACGLPAPTASYLVDDLRVE
jgi:hypothetical protein